VSSLGLSALQLLFGVLPLLVRLLVTADTKNYQILL
jgi:hypothetical protein